MGDTHTHTHTHTYTHTNAKERTSVTARPPYTGLNGMLCERMCVRRLFYQVSFHKYGEFFPGTGALADVGYSKGEWVGALRVCGYGAAGAMQQGLT